MMTTMFCLKLRPLHRSHPQRKHVMEEIAAHLGMDALEVRKNNVYRENCLLTPYGQTVEKNVLPQIFELNVI